MPREWFYRAGGYDESFCPMAYQDDDIMRRLRRLGLKFVHKSGWRVAVENPGGGKTARTGSKMPWSRMQMLNRRTCEANLAAGRLVANLAGWGGGQVSVNFGAWQQLERIVPASDGGSGEIKTATESGRVTIVPTSKGWPEVDVGAGSSASRADLAAQTEAFVYPRSCESIMLAFGRLVRRDSRGGMAAEHYARIAREVLQSIRRRMLIFGCGRDTPFWAEVCASGALFVEDQEKWSLLGEKAGASVLRVKYPTQCGRWQMPRVTLPEGLTEDFLTVRGWDVILVDGPRGCTGSDANAPGREQSAYAASLVRSACGAAVFMHDYDRRWDRSLADRYLGQPDQVIVGDGRQLAYWTLHSSRAESFDPAEK
jgi:hypothetical protein